MKNKIFILLVVLTMSSCMTDWLGVSPNQKLVVITSLSDMRALLDNTDILNSGDSHLGEASSDHFILSQPSWAALSSVELKNSAIWAYDIFEGRGNLCWENAFQKIFYSNLVLEKIEESKHKDKNSVEGKSVKGAALFFRAWSYFHIAQIFCNQYSENVIDDLGLPLRVESDMEIPSKRNTVKETYDLIISDLWQATELLEEISIVKTRPTKAAAYGLLAKVFLQIGQYDHALQAAEKCMSFNNKILDFQTLDSLKSYPFARFNEEVIFHSAMRTTGIFSTSNLDVSPDLFQSYDQGDLRKTLFFVRRSSGLIGFRGSYHESNTLFNGISVNEMVLIVAECSARLGNVDKALEYINSLLIKRYKSSSYVPVRVEGKEQALALILKERNKELLFRGVRWHDLKRLKREYLITLVRTVGSETFMLPPDDKRWTLPIPPNVVRLSGMQQNER